MHFEKEIVGHTKPIQMLHISLICIKLLCDPLLVAVCEMLHDCHWFDAFIFWPSCRFCCCLQLRD